MNLSRSFVDRSRYYLLEEYLPKIRLSIAELSQEDLWWRPNPASNSIGNLILHLAGNARQWVVSGVGGAPDVRQRDEEFLRRGGLGAAELLAHLEEALAEVDGVLRALPPEELDQDRTIQGMEVTVFEAIYHVVEHFSMHVGQIIYLAKARLGKDLSFYEIRDGEAKPRW